MASFLLKSKEEAEVEIFIGEREKERGERESYRSVVNRLGIYINSFFW